MTTPIKTPLAEIEQLAKEFADAENLLNERTADLADEVRKVRRARLPGIKTAVTSLADITGRLNAAIEAHPELFSKPNPRTLVLSGIKVGLKKGAGRVEIDDEAALIARIEKICPERKAELIETEYSVRKNALKKLDEALLKTLGVEITDLDDRVVITAAADDVEKFVDALLKQVSEEEAA